MKVFSYTFPIQFARPLDLMVKKPCEKNTSIQKALRRWPGTQVNMTSLKKTLDDPGLNFFAVYGRRRKKQKILSPSFFYLLFLDTAIVCEELMIIF